MSSTRLMLGSKIEPPTNQPQQLAHRHSLAQPRYYSDALKAAVAASRFPVTPLLWRAAPPPWLWKITHPRARSCAAAPPRGGKPRVGLAPVLWTGEVSITLPGRPWWSAPVLSRGPQIFA